jgi:toxin ParE1/3/4
MIPRIIIRPAADRDLDEQADYLARRSPESAARWYDAAASTLEFLTRNSEIGPLRETRRPELAGIRTWAVGGFPILPADGRGDRPGQF